MVDLDCVHDSVGEFRDELESLSRSPHIELAGDCERVSSTFLNQYMHIPVTVSA